MAKARPDVIWVEGAGRGMIPNRRSDIAGVGMLIHGARAIQPNPKKFRARANWALQTVWAGRQGRLAQRRLSILSTELQPVSVVACHFARTGQPKS
jgi:hypothetical protein